MEAAVVVYLLLWYVGNYYFNIFNKAAGIASGGAAFAFTLASLQLVIGSGWVVSLWVLGLRQRPALTASQVLRLLPLGLVTAVAHGSAIYANLAGSLSFSQIVKAGEPAFAAAVGYGVYRNGVSWRKLLCLVPVIGGIAIASATELDYTLASFAAVSLANLAAAFRGCENKRVMAGELQAALGGEGNAYGVTTLWAALLLLPVIFATGEYERWSEFVALWRADGGEGGGLRFNAVLSGLLFYLYNEVSTRALRHLSGVGHSVANTAKRAVVIVGSAVAFGEQMDWPKAVGCAIAIAGTFLYAIADDIPRLGEGTKRD
mmetsp:Transcript_47509/g.154234  ORF Transcript_47509/g.154234 Transcript_47509/m.154234 type:complete len:317 (+) Transcript_47509:90-1040(+)